MKTIPQFAILNSLATLFDRNDTETAGKSATTMQLLSDEDSARVAGGPECEVGSGG